MPIFSLRPALFLLLLGNAAAATEHALPQTGSIVDPDRAAADPRNYGEIANRPEALEEEPSATDATEFRLPPEDATTETISEAYELALDTGHYEQALELARRLLERVGDEQGRHSYPYACALSDLGAAYYHLGEFRDALKPLRRSIHLFKQDWGVLHPDLIGIHAYLGMSLQGLGKHREATEELSRAQSLTHRHAGAMNTDQLKLIYAKAESMEALGELFEAEQLYRSALRVSRAAYGEDSLEALQPLYLLAGWLRDHQRYRSALSLYREAQQVHQGSDGEDTPQMIGAMRGAARTFLLKGGAEVDRGLSLQRRIVSIMREQPRSFSLPERIRAHLQYGDWLLLFGREEDAWAAYRTAWNLAQQDEAGREDWVELMSEPKLIYAGPALGIDALGYQTIGTDQWVDFAFQVEVDGRPSHVRILEANTHVTTRRKATLLFREGRFRPTIVAGEPVVTPEHHMRRSYPTEAPPDYGVVDIGGQLGPRTRDSGRPVN